MGGLPVLTPEQMSEQMAMLWAQVRGLQQAAVGGQVPLDEKAIDQNYWDTGYFLAGAAGRQRVSLFTSRQFPTVAGHPQSGQTKTIVEFNMKTPGSFPSPDSYTIVGIKFDLMGSVEDGSRPLPTDVEMIRAYTIFRHIQGEKPVWGLPLDYLQAPGFVGAASANAGVPFINFGSPIVSDWYSFGFLIALKNSLRFSFELDTQPEFQLEEPVRFRVELVGQLTTTVR